MIIVSAGHVDHGKTALIHALTGTDTTHLPEEKKRGMTIDLGYAYLPLANGNVLGFIDVPGHERFLSNMLAGLGGVNYAMLVVAADEGIKPQTDEHLTLLKLLDFKQIILVITKADKVTKTQTDQLQQTLFQRYPFLVQSSGKSAVFVTSTLSGLGIAELRDYLATLVDSQQSEQPFRYAVDRVFHIKGAGKVVTGTAFAGQVALDDALLLSTNLKQALRVKNIHAQNQAAQQGYAGQRLAINLGAAEQHKIERGDWLFSHHQAYSSDRITLLLDPIQTLKASQPIHLYHAATHTVGKLTLLQKNSVASGEKVLAEVVLQVPLFLLFGDKLILRSGDNKQTLAGAKVLEINSPTRYKRSEMRLAYLWQLVNSQNSQQRLALYLQQGCVDKSAVCWLEQLSEPQFSHLQQQLGFERVRQYLFDQDYRQQQQQRLLQAVQLYHQQHTDQLGISKARLQRMACLKQPIELIYHLIEALIDAGQLAQTRGWIHLPDHRIEFTSDEQQLWQQVKPIFSADKQALWVRDLAKMLAVDEQQMRNFLYKAGKLGYLTAIIKDRFFLSETVVAYASQIKQHIQQHGEISVNELRDQLQFGRKMTVQLIEYFDKCGFLRRKGDVHLLRDGDIFEA
ncbi:selenocysteine-specific translation elongation factor [Testudinibacter sp. TR-2022]|uniref:selenocysteine-specific translation elongation factor n=1 Tax=Testudinibacter sp. TR-2022 TaxID=2585029 RepID=UPI001117E45C|nr:selenocysteine-specific translation elongation factor [Testudinibacter sp. TR-2022]TNH00940.1 selenocysteine-specific translation elongation factor [Pasteurellaceae bacterium Phil31]TNH10854.1 selenocysteine-specific translation elongation factor [Testudinibacter sp. TR-2022]TNH12225.1 selenocysteine-specific translation elongation factor [Testudinibacter sp. TR-2022]TNH15341.1 selenocysteine-specific translation elongation factor [Testudinibacter sp. TR-2022]TNH17317.1 selenocysteine-speci